MWLNGTASNNPCAEVLADFENGEYDVLCNSMLLTEGWDCPSVDCIVVLRPTKIRSLYQQMVGRGMRLYPGKDQLLLGGSPVLVALGGETYNILKKFLGHKYTIARIKHYSYTISKENYRKELIETLDKY